MDDVTPPPKPQPSSIVPPQDETPSEPAEPKDITNDPDVDSVVDEINKKDSDTLLAASEPKPKPGKSDATGPWYKRLLSNKKIVIPAAVVIVVAIVLAVPLTRYKIAGLFWKQTYTLTLDDSQTGQPITAATVTLAGKSATTNNRGVAKLHVRVGSSKLSVTKKYYTAITENILVPIHVSKPVTFKLHATGRAVPVTIVNKITGAPIENATVKAAGSEVQTDQYGKATIVLPTNTAKVSGSISASGYNTASPTIQVTSQVVTVNTFQLTPTGKVYFLSNLSGKEDVVAINLDGTDRQVILTGTGTEDQNATNLFATSDWQFLVLQAKRDTVANSNSLYIISTTNNNSVLALDKGNVTFKPIGWLGHYFIYDTTRNDLRPTDSNYEQLKSYNADNGQLKALDQSQAEAASGSPVDYNLFNNFNLVNNEVVYTVEWTSVATPVNYNGHSDTLRGIQPSGQGQKDFTTFDPAQVSGLYAIQYSPTSIYIDAYGAGTDTYYQFTSGSVKPVSLTSSTFYQGYPTYIVSPSGNQTFWSTPRDGKNTLLIGDGNGNSGKQIATLSDYASYGWYTDNYLLVTKQNELYIMPPSGDTPLKVADYQFIPTYGQ